MKPQNKEPTKELTQEITKDPKEITDQLWQYATNLTKQQDPNKWCGC